MILIGVVSALVVLVIVGVLAAIAIPVFLNQRAKATAAATTLTLPVSVGARGQLTDTKSVSAAAQVQGDLPAGAKVGVYGTPGDPSLIVFVYPKYLPAGADNKFVSQVAQGAAHEGSPMHEVDAGRLGGHGRCGELTGGGGTYCVYADPAGAVGVIERGTGAAAEQEALTIREQVEQRKG